MSTTPEPVQACPVPPDALSPAARKAADPATPVPARMMAARGLAPMPPRDLVSAQFVLTFDSDAKVQEAAKKSLANLDPRIANAVLGDTAVNGHVLGYLAVALASRDADVEKILLNTSTPASAFVAVAAVCSENVCEIIANNQARVLEEPEIARALIGNSRVLKSTIDRVVDFLVRSNVILDGIAEFESAFMRLTGEERVAAAQNVELPKEFLDDSYLSAEEREELKDRRMIADDEGSDPDAEDDSEVKKTLEQLLRDMTTGQKVAFASKGNKAVRSRLVRDTNRVVAIAAITAPSITELEIVQCAQSRTVHQDVISHIANNKDHTRLYPVKVALTNNPKTPLPIAMKFVPTLQKKDVRLLSTSKNVPAGVRALALKLSKASMG
jgi:hypothetical protein